jgi:hypothetical protein
MTSGTDRGVKKWTIEALRAHLQGALDLELWTIPYYLTTMYSIRDQSDEAFQLIQSIVHQEMLHAQIVGNLINAFGGRPEFTTPVYGGPQIPHLDFKLDDPDPTGLFTPYSTHLGPLDQTRINTLCLIEYPEWQSHTRPNLHDDQTQYGSIGDFYAAIRFGATELKDHLSGNLRQVDFFGSYYNNLLTTTITGEGAEGFRQAIELLDVVVEQGEGQTRGDVDVLRRYQNTADGFEETWPHYRKLTFIRGAGRFPATYAGESEPPPAGRKAQQILMRDFAIFIELLNDLFQGKPYQGFGAVMAKIGGEVLSCWQHNAIPKFS